MKARQVYQKLTDAELMDSFKQYGRQMEYYREYPVRSLISEMRERGLPISPSSKSKERHRPKGYDTPTGYMPFWGLQ
jgi:hypothetical protein